jgi:hypothetical protein
MNERIKVLAMQARQDCMRLGVSEATTMGWDELERFAELVRDDERDKCAADYLQDCCDAVEAARLEEREACAVLAEGQGRIHEKAPDAIWAKVVGRLIRARGNK